MRQKWQEYLRNPPIGSKAYELKLSGYDMEVMIENPNLTPEERIEKLQREMNEAHARGIDEDHYPDYVFKYKSRPGS